MNLSTCFRAWVSVFAIGGALCLAAGAQDAESLDTILDRGFVAHWLVCGPFENEVPGGVAGALQRGEAPLPERDYMEGAGGIARLRPNHGLLVRPGEDGALWQRAGEADETLDLAPFFPGEEEGIAYAAFYAESDGNRGVYFDLQTALGARVWLNGFPARDIRPVPVTSAGADRFVLSFRPGTNLVVFEIPGASYSYLAEIAGMSMRELSVHGFGNRPLLRGTSGFEMALRLQAAFPVGDLFYVPRLDNADAFSGAARDVRQDTLLTLFNPAREASLPVEVGVTSSEFVDGIVKEVHSVPPGAETQVRIPIPVGTKGAGASIPVTVRVVTGDAVSGRQSALFRTSVNVQAHAEGGRVYVVTGQRYAAEGPEDQSAVSARSLRSFRDQTLLSEQETEFGFDLGCAEAWRPALLANPDLWEALGTAIATNQCAAEAGFSHPDERLAGPEVLARNLIYGLSGGREILGDNRRAITCGICRASLRRRHSCFARPVCPGW